MALWPSLMLVEAPAAELSQASEAVCTGGIAVLEEPEWMLFNAEAIVVAALPVPAVLLGRRRIALLVAAGYACRSAVGRRAVLTRRRSDPIACRTKSRGPGIRMFFSGCPGHGAGFNWLPVRRLRRERAGGRR